MEKSTEEATLDKFLVTGDLGPLRLGTNSTQVFQLLGKPYTIFRPSHITANIAEMYYPNLRVTFYDDELVLIAVVFGEDSGELPPELGVDWYDMARRMNLTMFLEYLRANKIQCQRLVHDEPDELLCLRQALTEIYFPADADYKIKKILSSGMSPPHRILEPC